MPAPLRNVRSRMREDDEDDRSPDHAERFVIEVARHALRSTVERHAPAGADNLSLITTAVLGMAADILAAIPTAPELVKVINRQLARSGWQLVRLPRD